MSKLLWVASLLLAVTYSFGTTVVWGTAGPVYYRLEEGTGSELRSNGTAVAYLVYLGENVSSWYQNVSMWGSPGMDYEGSSLAEKATNASAEIGTGNSFSVTPGTAIGGTAGISHVLVNGQSSFGILFITHEWGGLVRYYYGEIATFNTSSANYSSETDSFLINAASSPGPSDHWDYSIIPEPATSSLALLGLAMLTRRRR